MKIKCVELSQFESDLILAFSRQPKAAPVRRGYAVRFIAALKASRPLPGIMSPYTANKADL